MVLDEFIILIDKTLFELDKLSIGSKMYHKISESYQHTFKVLNYLKKEMLESYPKIDNELLRAMHDIGMSSYKDFENTPLEDLITNISVFLYEAFPNYKNLNPLRGNFILFLNKLEG